MARSRSSRARGSRGKSARSRRGSSRLRLALWFNLLLVAAVGGWYLFQPPGRQAEVQLLVGNALKKEKRIRPWDVVWDLYQLYYSPDFVAVPPAVGDRTYAFGGLPVGPDDEPARFLINRGYATGYSEQLANPRWAAYRISDLTPLPAAGDRPGRFETDRRTVARVTTDAYTGTGFDRGHLAPNYAIATRYGPAAQEETFLLSNIIPQRHALNAGVWKELELRAATSYPARFGEVWVIAGPVFGVRPVRLGPGGPAVPEACFMIMVDESEGRVRAQAFLFPENTPAGVDPSNYLASIDEIERLTRLDFLPELPDDAEAAVEARPASRVW